MKEILKEIKIFILQILKEIKIFILQIEWYLRAVSIIVGILCSLGLTMAFLAIMSNLDKSISAESETVIGMLKIDLLLYLVLIFIPMVISILILVITRRFKDLNLLISEIKNSR